MSSYKHASNKRKNIKSQQGNSRFQERKRRQKKNQMEILTVKNTINKIFKLLKEPQQWDEEDTEKDQGNLLKDR